MKSSIEGLAIPVDAYRQHFKDKFDLDALREAAFGRYLIGPLKIPTVTRLSDRLVKQFQEKRVSKPFPECGRLRSLAWANRHRQRRHRSSAGNRGRAGERGASFSGSVYLRRRARETNI